MSLISSMRSNKLKLKRLQDEEQRTPHEEINEFIITYGDVFILPFLDLYDKDRITQGKCDR